MKIDIVRFENEMMKAKMEAPSIPAEILGNVTRTKAVRGDAPKFMAASSMDRSKLDKAARIDLVT